MALIGEMQYLTIGGNTYSIPTGGSTVTVSRSLTSGTKTATISVDGTNYDLYAPTPNAGTITSVKTTAGAHTAINVSSGAASFNVPTKTSHLTNDSGFLTSSDIASVLRYKGTKTTVSALPTSGNTTGDVWHITADGSERAWDGSTWQELGTAIDLSGYAQLAGASFTGPVSFGDSVTADELTTGDLVVNGAASFTNNIQANTINGVAVGTNPKFTDTNTDISTLTLATDTGTSSITLASAGKYKLTAGTKTIIFTMPTIPTVSYPVTSVNSKTGAVSLTYSDVSAASSSHTHGNITNAGDITATAPTIANGDQIVINDSSASKITNGPTFDGSTTTTALTPKGTWESFSKFSGSYNDLTNKPTIPTVPSNISAFTNDAGYITSADVPEGASAYTGTISAVSTSASNGTSNGFARGDHVHNITGTVVKSALGTGSGTTKFLREDGSWATPAYTTNTDAKLQVAAVTSGTTYYPIVGTGTTAATRQYDTTGLVYVGTTGTTSAVGSAKLTLGNSTASGTANNKQGQLIIYGSTAYAHTISGAPTAARALTLPDKAGTIALTSDIPTISYPVTSVNSKTGAVSLTASDIGALASNTTYVSTITTTAGTHSAISSKSGAVSFNVPTKTSHLTNDSGFITSYTDEKLKISTATSGSSYYPLLGNGTSAATRQYDTAFKFSGTNGTASGTGGSTMLTLGNSTTSSTAGWRRGIIQLYGYGAYSTTIENRTSTDNRTIILPDKDGTVALTSDVPTVPTNVSAFTNDAGYLTSYTDTNTWRAIQVNGTQILAGTTGTNALNLKAGSNVSITNSSGTVTIAATDTNTTYSAGTGLSLSSTTINHSNSVTAGTVGTSSATSGSTLAVPYVTYDAQGHITATGTHTHTISGFLTSSSTLDATKLSGTIPTGCYTNTKNTAGSTDSSSKLFLIGATSQAANPQTYSHDNVYINNSGYLYSYGKPVMIVDTLSSAGLTPYSSRCTIEAGGIYQIGEMVFVQIKLKNSSSLSSNNTWGYLDGFPVPSTTLAAISVYAVQNYGNISGQINENGRLVLATGGSALAASTIISVTGWYMTTV